MNTEKPLDIVVYGLWHLGCVTAASLASEQDFRVIGLDRDRQVIQDLQAGKPPIYEPGLKELITEGMAAGRLNFTTDSAEALREARLVWVALDTPVDEEDLADVAFVKRQLDAIFPYIQDCAVILISSQVPVGFTFILQKEWEAREPDKHLIYAYSPENLRLGNALKSFRAEDRIVVGLDDERGRELLKSVLSRFSPHLEWMSVKSAEMTKHALNSFLAISVAMINELARICEKVGADAKEVERGLKREARIGPKAYLGPGGPFAGGTLARDLRFLVQLGEENNLETPLFSGTLVSNEIHKNWMQQAAAQVLKDSEYKPPKVTILGLAYKPGTDTLRRSEAVSLGLWLVGQGAEVIFHDPVVNLLPEDLVRQFKLTNNLDEALNQADLLIVSTGWPLYREQLNSEKLANTMRRLAVIDQNRFLSNQLSAAKDIVYLAVGKPVQE